MRCRYLVVVPLLVLSHAGVFFLAGPGADFPFQGGAGQETVDRAEDAVSHPACDLVRRAEDEVAQEKLRLAALDKFQRPAPPGKLRRIEEIRGRIAAGADVEEVCALLGNGAGITDVPIDQWKGSNPGAAARFCLRFHLWTDVPFLLETAFGGDARACLEEARRFGGSYAMESAIRECLPPLARVNPSLVLDLLRHEPCPAERDRIVSALTQWWKREGGARSLPDFVAGIRDPVVGAALAQGIARMTANATENGAIQDPMLAELAHRFGATPFAAEFDRMHAAFLAENLADSGKMVERTDARLHSLDARGQWDYLADLYATHDYFMSSRPTPAAWANPWAEARLHQIRQSEPGVFRQTLAGGETEVAALLDDLAATCDGLPDLAKLCLRREMIKELGRTDYELTSTLLGRVNGRAGVFEVFADQDYMDFNLLPLPEQLNRFLDLPDPVEDGELRSFRDAVDMITGVAKAEPAWTENYASTLAPGPKRDALLAVASETWIWMHEPEKARAAAARVQDPRILQLWRKEAP